MDPAFASSSASLLRRSATHRLANRSGEYQSPPSMKITAPLTMTATLLTIGTQQSSKAMLATTSAEIASPELPCVLGCCPPYPG